MLQFDKQQIQFKYVQKQHLKASITIKNAQQKSVFFKFKITQPKHYLLKPDKGLINPYQTLVIQIILHRDGIPSANNDKIKCFYLCYQSQQQPQNMQRRSDTRNVKFTIKVNSIPPELIQRQQSGVKSSEVKSIIRQDNGFTKSSGDVISLQRQIQIKEDEIKKVKNQIVTMKANLTKIDTKGQQNITLKSLIIWAASGLFIGVVTSILQS